MKLEELIATVERTTNKGKVADVGHFSKEIVFYNANGDVIATYIKSTGRLRVTL